MRLFCFSIIVLLASCNESGEVSYSQKIKAHRVFLEAGFKGVNSPFSKEAKMNFKGLDFFNPDSTFKVQAEVVWEAYPVPVRMHRDSSINDEFYNVARLKFSVNDTLCELIGYSKNEKKVNSLFVPFWDKTNAVQSYGGGRYLDVEVVENQQVLLDFNLAYNPYCAYDHSYICAVPPADNRLEVWIFAGEKLPLIEKH